MPNIHRGRVAIVWYAERQKRAEEKAAKEAAEKAKQAAMPTTRQPKHTIADIWTPERDAIIKKCYRDDGPEVLAERFGKTAAAIQNRAHFLGLTGASV